jgi:Flp pilus assembly protein TadD
MGQQSSSSASRPGSAPAPSEELADWLLAFRKDPESQAFWPLARGRLAAGRLDDAIELLRHGLARHPSHTEARLALGRSLLARGLWTEAAAEVLLVTAAEPERAEAHVLLAEALDAAGNADGARAALERACDLAPDDELAPALLALLRETGKRRLAKVSLG